MSAILPSRRSAVIPARRVRSGRALSAVVSAVRFSAARLAEVESRYAALLASVSEGEYVLSEPTTVVIGTPGMDLVEIQTAVAMPSVLGVRRFLLNLTLGCETVELTPAKAREAADVLARVTADLYAKAADAEALTQIEAERR